MAAPYSKREKVLLTGMLFFFATTLLLFCEYENHAAFKYGFLGDSLTVMWALPRANLGIPGQTSTQILARYQGDLVGQHFARMYILAGTNDILKGVPEDTTIANLEALADISLHTGAQPILAEIPPIYRDNGKYLPAVQSLNLRILALAHRRNFKVIDYYAAMQGHPQNYIDGIHLKPRGYIRMELALLKVSNPFF